MPFDFENPLRVAVTGARGRMGSETVRAVTDAPDMTICATIHRGDDLAAILTQTKPDALVEFSIPEAAMPNIRVALTARVPPLIGTTGFSDSDRAEITELCALYETPALIAPNFALGAILMMRFAAEAARYLPDVEVIELHHERKVDAPSGTAARTAEMIAAARTEAGLAPKPMPSSAFETATGARGGTVQGIPVHSVRLSGYVASQEVLFGATGQRLSIRHDSIDRSSFMPGVLLALRKINSMSGLIIGLENLL